MNHSLSQKQQEKLRRVYHECKELFYEAQAKGRVTHVKFYPYGQFPFAAIESSKIPEEFQKANGKHVPFSVVGNGVRLNGHFVYSEPWYIFVPDRIKKEFRNHKAVHEYLDILKGDCEESTIIEFRTVSRRALMEGEGFLKEYTLDWIDDNAQWLEKATLEQREFLKYLPSASREILRERGFL